MNMHQAALIWLIYILLTVVVNWYEIVKRNISPNHSEIWVARCGIAIVWGAFVLDAQVGEFIPFAAFTGGSFWLVFDALLNHMRGLSVIYIGHTALLDKYGWKFSAVYYTGKILAIPATAWGYWFLWTTRH